MGRREKGVIILSTFPDQESARSMAKIALDLKLCACVNLTKVESIYSWKDKLEDQEEILALFKTTATAARKLKKIIAANHKYEVPEIVVMQMSEVNNRYFSWLVRETSADRITQKRNDSTKRRHSKSNVSG